MTFFQLFPHSHSKGFFCYCQKHLLICVCLFFFTSVCLLPPVGHTDIVAHGSVALSIFFNRKQWTRCFHSGLAQHRLALYGTINCTALGYQIYNIFLYITLTTFCLGTRSSTLTPETSVRFITDHNMATYPAVKSPGRGVLSYSLSDLISPEHTKHNTHAQTYMQRPKENVTRETAQTRQEAQQ